MSIVLQKRFETIALNCALSFGTLSAVSGQFALPNEIYLGTGIGYAKEKYSGESGFFTPNSEILVLSTYHLGQNWRLKNGFAISRYYSAIASAFGSPGGASYLSLDGAMSTEIGVPLQLHYPLYRKMDVHIGIRPTVLFSNKRNRYKPTKEPGLVNGFVQTGWSSSFGQKGKWVFQMQLSRRLFNRYELSGYANPAVVRFWVLRFALGYSLNAATQKKE